MNCPDCLTPDMTKEDASSDEGVIAGVTGEAAKVHKSNIIVAATYYCAPCAQYFRWQLGVIGLTRMPQGTKIGTQLDDDMVDPRVMTTRAINQETDRT